MAQTFEEVMMDDLLPEDGSEEQKEEEDKGQGRDRDEDHEQGGSA